MIEQRLSFIPSAILSDWHCFIIQPVLRVLFGSQSGNSERWVVACHHIRKQILQHWIVFAYQSQNLCFHNRPDLPSVWPVKEDVWGSRRKLRALTLLMW